MRIASKLTEHKHSYKDRKGGLYLAIVENAAIAIASIIQAPSRTANGPYDPARELFETFDPNQMRVWGAILFCTAMFQLAAVIMDNTKMMFASNGLLTMHWLWWVIAFGLYAARGGSFWGTILAGGLAAGHYLILARVR